MDLYREGDNESEEERSQRPQMHQIFAHPIFASDAWTRWADRVRIFNSAAAPTKVSPLLQELMPHLVQCMQGVQGQLEELARRSDVSSVRYNEVYTTLQNLTNRFHHVRGIGTASAVDTSLTSRNQRGVFHIPVIGVRTNMGQPRLARTKKKWRNRMSDVKIIYLEN